MDETALIKRPVVDDLAIKVEAFRNGQKSVKLAQKINDEVPIKRRVLIESFLRLAERYFGATREFVKNLSKEEGAELLNQVFQEAKRRLRWQAPLIYISFVVSIGLIPWMSCFYYNAVASFPAFKLRRLYKWYMENYGADDLEKAVKSGDFDKKAKNNNSLSRPVVGDLSIKKPEACEIILPAMPEGTMAEYEESVKLIGLAPAMLLQVKLAEFLKNRCVKIFKYNDIYEYLKIQSGKKSWYWRSLREKDVLKTYHYGGRREGYTFYGYCNGSLWECRPYSKLIPSRVCRVIEEVERQFGDKIHFLVSYYTDDPSDHYIAADALDMNMFIFDSWHDNELNQPGV